MRRNGAMKDGKFKFFEKCTPARIKTIGTAAFAVLLIAFSVALPVYAWLLPSKNLAGYAPVSAPESLYIGTGNEEDIRYLYFSGVDYDEAGQVEYVLSVQGEGIPSYGLQLGYTTNNPLTYSLYAAEQYTEGLPAPEGAVRYVSFDPSVADTFYVKTNDVPIEGREPNVQMSTTYGDYLHVDEHANPRYWQSAHSFAAEPMGFVHYYILRISWEEGENNRETDIICFAARVKFYE